MKKIKEIFLLNLLKKLLLLLLLKIKIIGINKYRIYGEEKIKLGAV